MTIDRIIEVIKKTQDIESVSPHESFQSLGIDSLDAIDVVWNLEKEFDVDGTALKDAPMTTPFSAMAEMIDGQLQPV